MEIAIYFITIGIGFFSPFLSLVVIGHLQETKKLFIISLSYLIVALVFIYSPLELYSRIYNALLPYTLLLVYGIIWGCLFKLKFKKYFKIVTIVFASIPLIIGLILSIVSLIVPLVIIGISADIRLDKSITLDNQYFIEESTWGWVSSSGKEYRVYRQIIPGLLKYKNDAWRENDMYFDALSIELDTTKWVETRSVSIHDKNKVLHTFNIQ
jgi:predicted membrane protein